LLLADTEREMIVMPPPPRLLIASLPAFLQCPVIRTEQIPVMRP